MISISNLTQWTEKPSKYEDQHWVKYTLTDARGLQYEVTRRMKWMKWKGLRGGASYKKLSSDLTKITQKLLGFENFDANMTQIKPLKYRPIQSKKIIPKHVTSQELAQAIGNLAARINEVFAEIIKINERLAKNEVTHSDVINRMTTLQNDLNAFLQSISQF